jgi:hypothetical protein
LLPSGYRFKPYKIQNSLLLFIIKGIDFASAMVTLIGKSEVNFTKATLAAVILLLAWLSISYSKRPVNKYNIKSRQAMSNSLGKCHRSPKVSTGMWFF